MGRTPPAEPDHLAALLGLYAGLLDEAEAPWRAPDCPQRQTRVDTCRADLRERGITRTTPRLWTRGAFWDLPTPTQDCVCLPDALRRQLPVVAGF